MRAARLPYGRQLVDDEDVAAVVSTLRSDWLTTGPKVVAFEQALAEALGAKHVVTYSSGTSALHGAVFAAGLGAGDEGIVPPLTFCATSNALLYQDARPVFADVEADTLNLSVEAAAAAITPRTRALLPVDFAGQPADLGGFLDLAERHRLVVIEDACHAIGARLGERRIGSISHMTVLSFHPVKQITTAEGGAVTTNDDGLAQRLRLFRNHGLSVEFRERETRGSWLYEMTELGFNYRLTDLQCALGLSQLPKLPGWIARRQAIAARYDAAFAELPAVQPLARREGRSHAYHLYVIALDPARLRVDRGTVFRALQAEGIGVNVHYIPVHLHPYYRKHLGTGPGLCPVAEAAYERIITLPLFPAMTDADVDDVITAVAKVTGAYGR